MSLITEVHLIIINTWHQISWQEVALMSILMTCLIYHLSGTFHHSNLITFVDPSSAFRKINTEPCMSGTAASVCLYPLLCSRQRNINMSGALHGFRHDLGCYGSLPWITSRTTWEADFLFPAYSEWCQILSRRRIYGSVRVSFCNI